MNTIEHLENPTATDIIAAHGNDFWASSCIMGRNGHDLYFYSRKFNINPCDPKHFNDGFPFRIWRDSGIGYALNRNAPQFSIDGQARTAEEAVQMALPDGVVVIAAEL